MQAFVFSLARSLHESHQRELGVPIYIYIYIYILLLVRSLPESHHGECSLSLLLLARSFHQSHHGELGVSVSIYPVIGQVFSPKPSWRAECPCHPEQCGHPERSRIPAARPRSWRPVWVVLQLTPLACWPASGPRTRRVSSKQRLVRHTH